MDGALELCRVGIFVARSGDSVPCRPLRASGTGLFLFAPGATYCQRQGWTPGWGKTACGLQLCQQPGPEGDAK